MKKINIFYSIFLLIISPHILRWLMGWEIWAPLTDFQYDFLYDSLDVMMASLGILLLVRSGYQNWFKWQFKWSYVGWFILLFLASSAWQLYIHHLFPQPTKINLTTTTSLAVTTSQLLIYQGIFHRCLIAPFIEEIIARGIPFALLNKWKTYYADVLFSALLFALNHLYDYQWHTGAVVKYFGIGIILAIYFRKTKSLYWVMVFHAFANAFPLLVHWLTAIGINMPI